MTHRSKLAHYLSPFAGVIALVACVPEGGNPGGAAAADAGKSAPKPTATAAPTFRPSQNIMREIFQDDFEKNPTTLAPASSPQVAALPASGIPSVKLPAPSATPAPGPAKRTELGPDWLVAAGSTAWKIEDGKLCGAGAKNKGIWLNRTLPINARIEFDAVSYSADGDLKTEVWGDGHSAATGVSYTNASSYLLIQGGWQNSLHVLARINEHGKDRKETALSAGASDVSKAKVVPGQTYRWKIERTDGKTVRWYVDGVEIHSFVDAKPLAGAGHDHFGFNNWEAKVCFDNLKVTPL